MSARDLRAPFSGSTPECGVDDLAGPFVSRLTGSPRRWMKARTRPFVAVPSR
jgi:hypothetical protein